MKRNNYFFTFLIMSGSLLILIILPYCSEVEVKSRGGSDSNKMLDELYFEDHLIQADEKDFGSADDIVISDDISAMEDDIKDTGDIDSGTDAINFDAGSCPPTLKDRIRIKQIDVSPDSINNMGGMYFSPYTPPIVKTFKEKYLLAYLSYNGKVRIISLNQNLLPDGIDVAIEANELRGLATSNNGFAVMIQRGADEMALVGFDENGGKKFDTTIIGNVNHQETWAKYVKREWGDYGTLGFYNNQYVAYFGHSMNWGEQGEHQGDLLWFFDTEGNKVGGMWDWGCSHSLNVRLAFNSNKLGAVCLSDCYPQKAICFNHREAIIHNEPSGNCAGRSNAELGGLVAFEDGFYHTFLSAEGRESKDLAIVKISNNTQVSSPIWLTNTPNIQESNAHLARYGENLLVAFKANEIVKIGLVDKNGNFIKPIEDIAEINFNEETIFENSSSGDVIWAFGEGSNLLMYMARYCN